VSSADGDSITGTLTLQGLNCRSTYRLEANRM
jgi:hypothetical protein